jgi:tRNA splicing endonuclease
MEGMSLACMGWEDRIQILRNHFTEKGYRVHSGLQFGCELVLYADNPGLVHSDFCVHLVGESFDWRTVQTLVRSMPDLHKTLILAEIVEGENGEYIVEELAVTSEHAPFRHRSQKKQVGGQLKKQKV